MKKTLRSLLALLLALCMLSSLMVGCTPKDNAEDTKPADTKPAETKPADTEPEEEKLERVDLVFWMLGDEPADRPRVMEKVNELLLEKVNATVTFQYTTWTDYINKTSMILSSKEECDAINTHTWNNYYAHAGKGAYTNLDGIIQEVAPELYALGTDTIWEQCKVNGELYGIPDFDPSIYGEGLFYREDLRKKYDLPVPDSLENLVAYLTGIKENEPDQPIYSHGVSTASFNNPFGFSGVLDVYDLHDTTGVAGLRYDYNNPQKMFDYWNSDQFRTDMKAMKQLADAGVWGKDVLNATPTGSLQDGGAVVGTGTSSSYIGVVNAVAEAHPDWEIGFIDKNEINGFAYSAHPMSEGLTIPQACKDVERTLKVIELLYTDKEINNLLLYGIEGEHYTLDENGLYVQGPKMADWVPVDNCMLTNLERSVESGIGLRQPSAELAAFNEQYWDIAAKTNYGGMNLKAGFIVDDSEWTTEKSACIAVSTEYLTPIQAGLVDDVDAAIDEFLEKMEAAGLKKIQESYMAQWEAYIAAIDAAK